ncbi:MAG: F-box-like domain-containing protein, partial [Kistimonas sp.]|nr:F-box-like domain-containing protein [Kistimonas sp.]
WHWHSARWSRITQFTREDARAPSPEARLLPPSDSHCLVSLWREGRLWIYGPDSKGTISQKASIALGVPVSLMRATLDGLWLCLYSQHYGCDRFVQVTTQAQGGTGRHSSVTGTALAAPGLTAEQEDEEQEEQETEPAPHAPESRQDERQQRVSPASLAHAQRLPIEILDKILGYVPLSQHSNCALVCRRWYDSLPDTGLRLAHWYNSLSADQKVPCRLLAAGYSSRARPFLQAARSPLLPVLDCQHQELLHQQAQLRQLGSRPSDTSQQLQQQVDRSFRLLSALVHYSQHRHLIQSQQLGLAPAPFIHADTASFRRITFSPCGRWLAVICQTGNEGATLMLHAWNAGAWHRKSLIPVPKYPVLDVKFSRTDPDILISIHSQRTLIWRREADTGNWRCQQGWKRPTLNHHWHTHAMEGGDFFIVSTRIPEPGEGVQAKLGVIRYIDAEHSWDNRTSCTFTATAVSTPRCTPVDQVALCTSLSHADAIGNTVYIFYKHPDSSGQALWLYQESVLQETKVQACQIEYSPADYSYLLVLMENWQLLLLKQNAQHCLQELFTVNTCIAPTTPRNSAIDLKPTLSGTRQLAVPYSPHTIQFWQKNAASIWEPGERIEASSEPDEYLCNVLFCNADHTLVRQTNRCTDIWHRGEHWQHLVRHGQEASDGLIVATLSSANGALCVTTGDATGSLWLYAPDSRGVPTRRLSTNLGEQIKGLTFSNDGLSVAADLTTESIALQLVPLPASAHQQNAS